MTAVATEISVDAAEVAMVDSIDLSEAHAAGTCPIGCSVGLTLMSCSSAAYIGS